MTWRHTVHFTGRVQGVGFRYITATLAKNHRVSGFVQNLSDGRVRLVIEGEQPELDGFVAAIRHHMDQYITGCTIDPSPASGEFGPPAAGAVKVRH